MIHHHYSCEASCNQFNTRRHEFSHQRDSSAHTSPVRVHCCHDNTLTVIWSHGITVDNKRHNGTKGTKLVVDHMSHRPSKPRKSATAEVNHSLLLCIATINKSKSSAVSLSGKVRREQHGDVTDSAHPTSPLRRHKDSGLTSAHPPPCQQPTESRWAN